MIATHAGEAPPEPASKCRAQKRFGQRLHRLRFGLSQHFFFGWSFRRLLPTTKS